MRGGRTFTAKRLRRDFTALRWNGFSTHAGGANRRKRVANEDHSKDEHRQTRATGDDPSSPLTGLPLLHSWRTVYIVVMATFVLWVVLMTVLQRMFS